MISKRPQEESQQCHSQCQIFLHQHTEFVKHTSWAWSLSPGIWRHNARLDYRLGKNHGRKAGDDCYVNTEKTLYILLLHGNPAESPGIRVKIERNQSSIAIGFYGRLFGQAKEIDEHVLNWKLSNRHMIMTTGGFKKSQNNKRKLFLNQLRKKK